MRGDVSSQYVTALLMALPLVGRSTIAIEGDLVSKPYVEMTLNLMARFGVPATRTGWSSFTVPPRRIARRTRFTSRERLFGLVLLAAGAISGARTAVRSAWKVRSLQHPGRRAVHRGSRAHGRPVRLGDSWIEVGARAGSTLTALDADLNHIPDAAMTAAMLALFADGTSVLRNIGNWRVKETDRLAAMATELRKLGATVEEGTDHLRVTPPTAFRAATIDTYDDHRMAMCFSLAALGGVPCASMTPPACARPFRVLQRVPSDGGGER